MPTLVLFLALVISGCATAPPECCDVRIGPSQYEYLSWQIINHANGGATLLSPDFSRLWDGRPSTQTRFEYNTSGTQTASSAWALQIQLAQQGGSTPDSVVAGMVLIKKTNMPPGAVVQIMPTNISDSPIGFGSMQLDESGVTTSACILFENQPVGPIVVAFLNNDGSGSQYMTDGEAIEIGEIRVSESFEFCLKRTPKIGWANINKQRFTSSGLTLPVLQPQLRTLQFEVAPLAQQEAINDGNQDMMTVIYTMMSGNVFAVVPFEGPDPALYPAVGFNSDDNYKIRAKTAMLASFSGSPGMAMNNMLFWDTSMSVTESI